MPIFDVEANGKSYEVDAPDMNAAMAAIGGGAQQAPSPPQDRGVVDKLFGLSGPRYQTWPERLVRGAAGAAVSGATLPGDVYQDAQKPAPAQISDSDVSPLSAGRAFELASMGTPINPAVRAGDRAIPGMATTLTKSPPKPPTATQLDDIASQGYNVVRNMGVEFRPEFPQAIGQGIEGQLRQRFPETATGTYGILKDLQTTPKVGPGEAVGPSSYGQLENARQQLREVARNWSNPTDKAAAQEAISLFDSVMSKMPESAVVAGPTSAARDILAKTRGDYAAARRVNEITGELDKAVTGIGEKADLQAGVTHSGRNFDNTARQGLAALLKSKPRTQGFTEDELAAIGEVAKGTGAANKARTLGNLLGGGGGLGASVYGIPAVTTALATGNPAPLLGLAFPAAGFAVKSVENKITKNALNDLAEMLAKRSPLYEERLANAPLVAGSAAKKAALLRALMLQQQQQ